MLRFHPQQMRYDLWEAHHNLDHDDTQDIEETPKHTRHIFIALRDENKCLATDALAYIYYQRSKNERRQRLPKGRDLVVVRNYTVDSQRGRKLEGRWLGPRILVSYTAAKLSAYVREVHGVRNPKRYHLNEILFYNLCSFFWIGDSIICQNLHGTNPTVIGGHGTGEPGARVVFLHCSCWDLRQVRNKAWVGGRWSEMTLWTRMFFFNGRDLSVF